MKLENAIATARVQLNDPLGVTYSDPTLLGYANDALDAIVALAPRYFYQRGQLTCVAGEVEQVVSFDDAHALVSVDRILGGGIVTPADKTALDQFDPTWPTHTAAAAVHWMPYADSQVKFYLYPKAPTSQVLDVTYVRLPPEFAADADTGLPVSLEAAVADYVVAMAMTQDDEHVNNNRAQAALASFQARLKGA